MAKSKFTIYSGSSAPKAGEGLMNEVSRKANVSDKSAIQQLPYTQLIENKLNEEEVNIVKRGRNAKSDSVAKNVDVVTYRIATGLEALWGWLYLSGRKERLEELWRYWLEVKEVL